MTAILEPRPTTNHIVHVDDALRVPVSRTLRQSVHDLLRRGRRRILLDLSTVSRIDAAGVGELVRTFNMTAAVNGQLRVVNATAWVGELLERANLLELLSGKEGGQVPSHRARVISARMDVDSCNRRCTQMSHL